jgi:hypothetical protein
MRRVMTKKWCPWMASVKILTVWSGRRRRARERNARYAGPRDEKA